MAALLIPCLTEWDFLPPDSRANAGSARTAPTGNPFSESGSWHRAGSGRAGGSRGLQAMQHEETIRKY